MITITNPETGTKHRIDADAAQELADALHRSSGGTEIVFRAMRLDKEQAELILNNCGFETINRNQPATLGDMVGEDDNVRVQAFRDEQAKETE